MQNRYKKLFACAKELGISIEELRQGAASFSGEYSLRSLSGRQLRLYEEKLNSTLKNRQEAKRRALREQFVANEFITIGQREYLIDLISSLFRGDVSKFRSWLANSFGIGHERFISKELAPKVLKAASSMKARGYRTR